jgi:hypothetical protein
LVYSELARGGDVHGHELYAEADGEHGADASLLSPFERFKDAASGSKQRWLLRVLEVSI